MKLSAIISLACVLLFLLNVHRAESSRPFALAAGHHAPGQGRHAPGQGHHYDSDGKWSFYVFGDSFADTGNLLKKSPNSELSRQWYPPYMATGRFSNGMVLSDFVANIIGQSMSPPAHRQTRNVGPEGMNFAVGGSGVFDIPDTQTLRRQIHTFSKLVNDGDITEEHLSGLSVALVAVSGNDYAHVTPDNTDNTDIMRLAANVTAEIVKNVARLKDIGVQNVLVNNLPPIGCAPLRARPNNIDCFEWANQVAIIHNTKLDDQLRGMPGVLVVDLNAAFSNIVGPYRNGDMTNLFPNQLKLVPCCESKDPKGYCGQVDPETDEPLYTVCPGPDSHFYWDDMNPTNGGWEAVMGYIDRPIEEFLEIRR